MLTKQNNPNRGTKLIYFISHFPKLTIFTVVSSCEALIEKNCQSFPNVISKSCEININGRKCRFYCVWLCFCEDMKVGGVYVYCQFSLEGFVKRPLLLLSFYMYDKRAFIAHMRNCLSYSPWQKVDCSN